jgi:hypothetical protein
VQRDAGPYPWNYLAIYECDAPRVEQVIEGLRARSGTPDMPLSSAMADVRYVCYFEPLTEVLRAQL